MTSKVLKLCLVSSLIWLASSAFGCQPQTNLPAINVNATGTAINASSTWPISQKFIGLQVFRDTDQLSAFGYQGQPLAGVVNHHVLAADLQARFFKTLKKVRPDIQTFIILSPDHFNRGQGISTSRLPYLTPAGLVSSTGLTIKQLNVWDGTDERVFEDEHGVGALAPFIAREFPKAKIVPIFLKGDLPQDQADRLGKALATLADDKTFVVLSSDMSHYLTKQDALAHDTDTINWLQTSNWTRLASATDKNTDSSVGLSVLHAYLRQKAPLIRGDEGGFSLLAHKISTDYGADSYNTTSYIVGFWE